MLDYLMNLRPHLTDRLLRFASALIDQHRARVVVAPHQRSAGFWFGGGNVVKMEDGSLLLCGRYRQQGDSRVGTGAGARGMELALFQASSPVGDFEKVRAFAKNDVACGGRSVVSIEGSALHRQPDGSLELFVSSEKEGVYPERLASFQKPGTGVWSIDRMTGKDAASLDPATLGEVVPFGAPERLHVKDPVVTDFADGSLGLIYCTHPFSWSSSGTSVCRRSPGKDAYEMVTDDLLPRGPVWDIAAARITNRLPVPRIGVFAELPPLSLYFYDSCESLRQLDENPTAVKRPRGYSCEELGGLAAGWDDAFPAVASITIEAPLFVSPFGTGCSRYVSTLDTGDGVLATWQQGQEDRSQPLVGHFLTMERVAALLG